MKYVLIVTIWFLIIMFGFPWFYQIWEQNLENSIEYFEDKQ